MKTIKAMTNEAAKKLGVNKNEIQIEGNRYCCETGKPVHRILVNGKLQFNQGFVNGVFTDYSNDENIYF